MNVFNKRKQLIILLAVEFMLVIAVSVLYGNSSVYARTNEKYGIPVTSPIKNGGRDGSKKPVTPPGKEEPKPFPKPATPPNK